jgi:hypothetical protein
MATSTPHRPAPLTSAPLSALDHELLQLASRLRVVTQTQLERLLPDVPERTLRYRTRRLREQRLLGRTRPYRDRGSAPAHLWPTTRGDAIARGQAPPRRGERRPPNPLFLAHAAALSELYVVLRTSGPAAGFALAEFLREGEARERFADADGSERAIAPDLRIVLRHEGGALLSANVELDLGTMSHARLRRKLDGYLAHARACAARELPTLLFVTTSDRRAATFARTAARRLATAEERDGRLAVAICDRAHALDDVVGARCWLRPGAGELVALADLARR